MNSLNSSSVDAGVGTAIVEAEKEEEAKTGASGAGKFSADILIIGVALGLTDGGAVVFRLEGAELLEREDFWKPLPDLIRLALASLLATL